MERIAIYLLILSIKTRVSGWPELIITCRHCTSAHVILGIPQLVSSLWDEMGGHINSLTTILSTGTIDHSGDLQLLMCLYQLIENLLIPSQCCANLNGRNYRAIHQPLRRTTQLHADPLRVGPVRRGDQLKVMTYSCF